MEKVLITGTGRSGTTFLIKLFSFLGFDTGYDKNNYKNFISTNCNSGMEKQLNDKHYILKNPYFINEIESILNDKTIKIKTVIIPLRDLRMSAISRVRNGINNGGLWNARDENSQIQYYKDILTRYLLLMTKYDIDTIFIDFDRMISDKKYLYDKLNRILNEKNIDFETFCINYDEVTATSKP